MITEIKKRHRGAIIMIERIKNLNIGVKIALVFTVLILLSIAMVGIGYSSLKLVAHKSEISQDANHISKLMLETRVNQVKFMRSSDRKQAEKVNTTLTEIKEKIKILKAKMNIAAEKEEMDNINNLVTEFETAFNNYAQTTYQQQDYRQAFVNKEQAIIKPLDELSNSQNQELTTLIQTGSDLEVIEQKQASLLIIKEIIKHVQEMGKEERNLVLNAANDGLQEKYINNTVDQFEQAKEHLQELRGNFSQEADVKQVKQLLANLEQGRESFANIVESERQKDKQKNGLVKAGDQVA